VDEAVVLSATVPSPKGTPHQFRRAARRDAGHPGPAANTSSPVVTRQTVLELCRELGIPFEEFPILEHWLDHARECMLLSTFPRSDARSRDRWPLRG